MCCCCSLPSRGLAGRQAAACTIELCIMCVFLQWDMGGSASCNNSEHNTTCMCKGLGRILSLNAGAHAQLACSS